MIARSITVLLLLASYACAGYRDAVVQLHGITARGGDSFQSGVIFKSNDNGSYVLTAAHFHRDQYDEVRIGISNDRWYEARNIGYEKDFKKCDLSLFHIDAPNQDCIPISRDAIRTGEECTQIGHPRAQSEQRVRRGRLLSLWQGRLIEASFSSVPGDSGAPLINSKQELIGIVSGYNRKQHSVSTPRGQIFTFLKRFCPDGQCEVPRRTRRRRKKPVPTHPVADPIEGPIDPPLPPAPPHDHALIRKRLTHLEDANENIMAQVRGHKRELVVLQSQIVQIGEVLSKIEIPVIDYDKLVDPADYDRLTKQVDELHSRLVIVEDTVDKPLGLQITSNGTTSPIAYRKLGGVFTLDFLPLADASQTLE